LNPEDVDTKSEDHAFDALAYGALKVLPTKTGKANQEKGWRYRLLNKLSGGSLNWKTS